MLEKFDGDEAAAENYLKEQWGETFDTNVELYQMEEVFAGRYHGKGEDLTDEISAYLNKIITSGKPELIGCIPVDENLARLLQQVMDKYTFENVEDSWTKLCYYYDHLGPQ